MNANMPGNRVNFTLSETGKRYICDSLTYCAAGMAARGLVVCLTYSGGFEPQRAAKIVWSYRGPNFLIAGHKPQNVPAGEYYDLLGFRVWIGDIEHRLLEGRTLTTIQYGSPEPAELLVIENDESRV